MQQLNGKKLVAGFPRGCYSKAMLRMIAQVFADVPGHVDNALCLVDDRGQRTDKQDALKEWLVQWLGDNLEFITKGRGAVDFWTTLDRGVGLKLAVSRCWASINKMSKGSVVRIE